MKAFSLLLLSLITFNLYSQTVPFHWNIDESAHQITQGKNASSGIYNSSVIKEFYLTFDQSNYWTLLTNNYGTESEIPATLEVDGVVYPQVGVAFKGQTSYMQANGEKKSFSIKTDSYIAGQTLERYKTFNLNNSFQDPSFMREFLYLSFIKKHIPAAQVSYVHLFINGEDWGLYPNVQQMNKDYLEEWFLSNNGTLWRADAPSSSTGGPGGGPQWGDGTAALNYNGASADDYTSYYTLKSTDSTDPWQYLIDACDVLNNTPIDQLEETLNAHFDVDRTLWFLASEIAFGDDDSYVYKGKMDYYVYWDAESGRTVPLEYDGNSVLESIANNWSPFYHADNANYPLLNRILQVPAFRQRYLAHLRTIIDELLDLTTTQSFITEWGAFIDAQVQNDPKKLTTYTAFQSELSVLQQRLTSRRNTLMNNSEVNVQGPLIENVEMQANGNSWTVPSVGQEISVHASVSASNGVDSVILYYSIGLVGDFEKIEMASLNGSYQAILPSFDAGDVVRFYIEAIADNTAGTRSYSPKGAEHDVYYFHVMPSFSASSIVINELMASNTNTAIDESGEYDDWIELYNTSDEAIDLTGFHITDNTWNLTKFQIPDGTSIDGNSYLIIWADEDGTQGPLHANFKLSAAAESVTLLNPEGSIADFVDYGQQQSNMGYARVPNGLGPFYIQLPTFNSSNGTEVSLLENELSEYYALFPNPFDDELHVVMNSQTGNPLKISIFDTTGKLVFVEIINTTGAITSKTLTTRDLQSGVYIIKMEGPEKVVSEILLKK